MSNTCALRASFGKQKATVLEAYLRMDRTLNLAQLQDGLCAEAQSIVQEAAWGLGIPAKEAEITALVNAYLAEIE